MLSSTSTVRVHNGAIYRKPIFPSGKSVHYYFRKWTRDGTLQAINLALNQLDRLLKQRNPWPSLALIDSQSILLAPMIGRQRGVDGNKKVNGRKRHILTDVYGRIYGAKSHAANLHDSPQGVSLLYQVKHLKEHLRLILADKTYRGTFARAVASLDIEFEVPQRPEGTKGFVVEAKRWAVERSFAWLNFFRRIDKGRERTVASAQSFVILANTAIMLNRILTNPN